MIAAALLLAGAVLVQGDVWILRRGAVAGPPGDSALFIWYLRWTPWAIAHGVDPLVTTHILAPSGANLMWNTSIVLPAIILWPVTATVGEECSYSVLMTLAPMLSGLAAYFALRRHAGFAGAITGAVLYGFSPALMAHSLAQIHRPPTKIGCSSRR